MGDDGHEDLLGCRGAGSAPLAGPSQLERRLRGDPLAGRERPAGLGDAGRGLWIVNQLCDLVQVRGGVVRLHVGV